MSAAALLLYSPSLVAFTEASPPSLCHSPFISGRRPSASFVSPFSRHSFGRYSLHPSLNTKRKASHLPQNPPILDTTWSNAVRQKQSVLDESRYGVRERVRSVLGKAKKRTGIDNTSVDGNDSKKNNGEALKGDECRRINGEASFSQSGLNIIAETASIGGLDLMAETEGRKDVALDYISRESPPAVNRYNDASQSVVAIAEELPSRGEKYENRTILSQSGEEVNGASGAIIQNGVKASLPPLSAPTAFQRPEDKFVLSPNATEDSKKDSRNTQPPFTFTEKEAFTGDVSAAFSLPREPLPFELPTLNREQSRRLFNGERIQFQEDMGRAGSGYVVWDVKAPASVVWDCLLDFQSYPKTITTVREVVMYTNTHLREDYRAEKPLDFEDGTAAICQHGVPSVTRAQFSLSKFRLKIAAVHKYRPHPQGDYMIFTLDPASRNPVLKQAKGIWYTQSNPEGKEGHTRVWLLCELRVSRLLPQWIVDYAATRAMPRATTWLKPMTEAAATLWLRDSTKR